MYPLYIQNPLIFLPVTLSRLISMNLENFDSLEYRYRLLFSKIQAGEAAGNN